MGGKASKGTPPDRRLAENQPSAGGKSSGKPPTKATGTGKGKSSK